MSSARAGQAASPLLLPLPPVLAACSTNPSSRPLIPLAGCSYGRSSSAARSPVLGRATSSKRCIVLACVAAALTIALGVGLGVGLSSGGDNTGSSDTAGGAGEPTASPSPSPESPPTFVPATLMTRSADGSYEPLTSLSEACQQLAQGEAWVQQRVPRLSPLWEAGASFRCW